MKFINTETGAIIDVQSEMSGCWKPLEDKKPDKTKPKDPAKSKPGEEK